jgi:glyoxylase-like metal-dependent hydrolase (beta-lactamase superfamily II)
LNSELARLGMTLDDVRALILTHGDTDHIGFAAQLHREKGIPAYLHPADADRARLEVKKPNSGWGPVKAGPLAGFLWYSARNGGLRIRPVGELRPVDDGQVLESPARPGSSTHQATRQGASPSTSRRSTLCSSATP